MNYHVRNIFISAALAVVAGGVFTTMYNAFDFRFDLSPGLVFFFLVGVVITVYMMQKEEELMNYHFKNIFLGVGILIPIYGVSALFAAIIHIQVGDTGWLIYLLFTYAIGTIIAYRLPERELFSSAKASLSSSGSVSKADELQKYAQLFQSGMINQEEFDKKKQELL